MSLDLDARGISHLPEDDALAEMRGGHAIYRIADWFAAAVAVAVTGAVLVNIFALQTGGVRTVSQGATSVTVEPKPRPASAPVQGSPGMIFAPPAISASAPAAQPAPPPRVAAPAVPPPAPAPQNALLPPAAIPVPKTPSPLVAEIQRELARRGLYDGAPDGLSGPKTEAAVRAFEQSAHMRVTGEPTEAVLQQLRRAPPPVAAPAAPRTSPPPQAAAQVRQAQPPAPLPVNDSGITGSVRPPGDVQGAPSARLLAVQQALARLGYGPIKLDGQPGSETRLAIQRFERDRNLPVTGDASDRVVRELAAVSGTPID